MVIPRSDTSVCSPLQVAGQALKVKLYLVFRCYAVRCLSSLAGVGQQVGPGVRFCFLIIPKHQD